MQFGMKILVPDILRADRVLWSYLPFHLFHELGRVYVKVAAQDILLMNMDVPEAVGDHVFVSELTWDRCDGPGVRGTGYRVQSTEYGKSVRYCCDDDEMCVMHGRDGKPYHGYYYKNGWCYEWQVSGRYSPQSRQHSLYRRRALLLIIHL